MTPLLELDDISVRFGALQALDGVSLAVERGSVCALIGPNGAGKTTCMNVLSGIQVPTGGSIRFDGKDVTRRRPHRRRIGRTFQIVQLFPMTVRENVMVGLQPRLRMGLLRAGLRTPGVRREERWVRERADELLLEVGLIHLGDRPAQQLSLGQQRLVELARALAGEPELVLLDEAASGLSPQEIGGIVDQVHRLREQGRTVLLVEHNMRFVNRTADSLVVLDYGKVIFSGRPAEGLADEAVVTAYLGKEAKVA
jgi:ABC-type branched-subunit amino acid transport system ATPase component